jgi:acetyl esterase/lipase
LLFDAVGGLKSPVVNPRKKEVSNANEANQGDDNPGPVRRRSEDLGRHPGILKSSKRIGRRSTRDARTERARRVLEDAQAGVDVDVSGIDESTITINTDVGAIELTIVRPAGNSDKLPVFMFIHGGGWVLGDYPTHKRLVRDLVVESGFAAAFINYTRTPEAVYPQQTNETYAATKWVAENADEINVDATRLAVVGNSVGGNLTAATALKAIAEGGPAIKSLVMMWPVTDADFERESWAEFGTDRFLTAPLMKWMWDLYAPAEKRGEALASPFRATAEQLKQFPPTLVQVRRERHPSRRRRSVRTQAG